jgi:hypothetical protein
MVMVTAFMSYEAEGGCVNLGLSFLGAVDLAVGADVIRGDHVRVFVCPPRRKREF